jgi:hypothetical protein
MAGPNFGWYRITPRAWIAIVMAFGAGLVLGLLAIIMQEHHGFPWPSLLLGAPLNLLARLTLGHGFVYAYTEIGGTAALGALYAYLLTDGRLKGGWFYVVGFHTACAIVLVLIIAMR